jgi:hypothetical protein
VTASPEHQIRRYLEERGGRSEATVDHLLVSFGVDETDERGRIAIVEALRAVGVRVDRPLDGMHKRKSLTLSLSPSDSSSLPPWSKPETATRLLSAERRRRGVWVIASLAAVVVAASAAAAGGYDFGKRSGVDLDRARAKGIKDGRRAAAARVDPGAIVSARHAGRRAGDRRAHKQAFAESKERVLAAAPQACGDVRTSETPSLVNVRAQGVSCEAARSFVTTALNCGGLEGECQGYNCEPVSIGWESSEVTCTSGNAQIRFITGV